jgi:hypothetical protein
VNIHTVNPASEKTGSSTTKTDDAHETTPPIQSAHRHQIDASVPASPPPRKRAAAHSSHRPQRNAESPITPRNTELPTTRTPAQANLATRKSQHQGENCLRGEVLGAGTGGSFARHPPPTRCRRRGRSRSAARRA